MANVQFLRGSQAKFDTLASFVEGAFYLTNDTDRLYFAQSATEAVYLNKSVHTVANENGLKDAIADGILHKGDLVYLSDDNILAYMVSDSAYRQINKNTNDNDDTKVTSVSFERDEAVTDKIKMNLVLKQVTKHIDNSTTEVADVIGSFELTEDDFNAIVEGASVSVGAEFATNKATIKTAGLGANAEDAGVSIEGAGSVVVSGSDDAIVITGTDTKYELGSAANSTNVTLTRLSDNNAEDIAFVNGQDIVVSGVNEDEIKIAHTIYDYSAPAAIADQAPAAGQAFDIVSGVTLSNGHVTGISTAKVTLPGEKWYTVSDVDANANGDLIITVKDQANSTSEVKAEKQLYYKVGDALVYNQSDLKDYFYTEAEIDDKLNGLNAMTYRGTVGTAAGTAVTGALANLPTEGVKVGDTYMVVGTDGVIYGGGEKAGAGDLLIATGTETNGIITSNLAWTYVPSANEIDTTYELSVEGTNIVLTGSDNDADSVAISGDDTHIATAQAADGKGIVVSHKDVARDDGDKGTITPAANTAFDVVQEVVSDAKGHITSVKVVSVTLPEDNDTKYELAPDADNKKFALKENGNIEQGSVSIDGGAHINVTAVVEGKDIDYTVAHADVARNDGDVKSTAPVDRKFTVITNVTSDAQGHITAAEKTEFTLPEDKDTTYTLSGAVEAVEGGVSITDTLTNSNNVACGTSVHSLKSDSLKVANTGNDVTVELEWGTF